MYAFLLSLHSWFRWIVLFSLVYALIRNWQGWLSGKSYDKADERARLLVVNTSHLQLLIGFTLYFVSPITSYFLSNTAQAMQNSQTWFFGILHISLMIISVITLTVGSSLARRAASNRQKFRLMAICCTIGLLLILLAIPWPFSPLAQRPWLRL